jgi:hypothetical protein
VKESPAGKAQKTTLPQDASLDRLIHDRSKEVLTAVAADSRLTEDLALAMLNRRDLPREALQELNKNGAVVKHRKVRLAIVMHPRTPRHVSIPAIRHLYPFELMQVMLFPAVAADVKRVAEETLIGRMKTISSGERFGLAKQSPGRVAAALLFDQEERTMLAALANSRMTEALIIKALRSEEATELLVAAVCQNPKWSRRNDIKMVLLGHEKTSFAKVLQLAAEMPVRMLKEVLRTARLSDQVKSYLQSVVKEKTTSTTESPSHGVPRRKSTE